MKIKESNCRGANEHVFGFLVNLKTELERRINNSSFNGNVCSISYIETVKKYQLTVLIAIRINLSVFLSNDTLLAFEYVIYK